jgi:hypothetical protein
MRTLAVIALSLALALAAGAALAQSQTSLIPYRPPPTQPTPVGPNYQYQPAKVVRGFPIP